MTSDNRRPEPSAATASKARVWIVDDSPLEAELTRRHLAGMFDVEVFGDGAALLEQLTTVAPPDAVIVDWQMPGMSGIDICQFLRSQPALSTIAVLMLTVHNNTRDLVDGLGAGADDFLSKPFVPAELVARVSSLLRAKDLRDQLARAEESVRSILSHLPDAVVCVDDQDRVAFLNLEAERVLGQSSAALAGKLARETLPASLVSTLGPNPASHVLLDDVAIGARTYSPALRRYSVGRRTETAISLRDVTAERGYDDERSRLLAREHKARTEAEEANRAKDEFLAVVSHELRTPLNAMLGWSRMLRSGAVRSEERKQHALETIERNAMAQAQLIEDIFDVSRIITGKLRLSLSSVSLAQVIAMVVEAVRPVSAGKNMTLETDIDPSIGPVPGDPHRLQQVVSNLVSNAVKFSRAGGRVKVALRRFDASTVEIEVTDDGDGIDASFLPFIFERFRQAEATTTRVHGGLGLGLAIVRHIVELHGGTVAASSEGKGHGARFVVRLSDVATDVDIALRSEAAQAKSSHQPPALAPNLRGVKLVIVEDDHDSRDFLASAMTELGAAVTACESVAVAMDQLKVSLPDVIVSDIGMPHEDGYAFLTKVRALGRDAGGDTPVVALTAYVRDQDRLRTIAAGFDMYLPKPVDPLDLGVVVASLIARRRRQH